MGTHLQRRAPDGGQPVSENPVVLQVLAILLRELAGDLGQAEHVAIKQIQLGDLCFAESRSLFKDGVQYIPGARDRAGGGSEELPRRRRLVAGVLQLLSERVSSNACSARRAFAGIGHSSPFRTS